MLNTDNKTAAARRVGALCVVTMATAYVFRSPSACIADLWVTFSLTESFRSSLAFWALRCVTSSGLTCAHTHKHTRPVETCRLALSSGRPFSCEVAVYSSRTTALPATPFGASAVHARTCVHPCMLRRMCVFFHSDRHQVELLISSKWVIQAADCKSIRVAKYWSPFS